MKRFLFTALLLGGSAVLCSATDFAPPIKLKAGEEAIRVERPGYACPCLATINGKQVLLVGQFAQGKIKVYPHLGGDKFGTGDWLKAEGKVAEVPGVW